MSTKTLTQTNQRAQRRFGIRNLVRMTPGYDFWIHFAIMALAVFGIIMVGSASMGLNTGNNRYLLFTVIKQILYAMIGYVAMVWLSNRFTLKFLKTAYYPSVFIGTTILLLLCLAFREVNGAKAWLRVFIAGTEVSFQPSEIAKIVAYLTVAAYCADVKREARNGFAFLWKPLFIILTMIFVVLVLQSDFGSALVIFIVACVSFLVPSHRQLRGFQIFLKISFWAAVVFAIYILSPAGEHMIEGFSFLAEYQKNRFLSASNPFHDQYNTGYQLINGLVAFATGNWLGTGFGSSVRKYTNFPAANTDFILAVLVEELGYVGFLLLMLLYGIIIFRTFRYAMKIKSERAKVVLIGTATYLIVHMFFNIGGVTGLVPLTGIPLLMISAGGSSMMSFMASVGISQAVIAAYRRKEIQ